MEGQTQPFRLVMIGTAPHVLTKLARQRDPHLGHFIQERPVGAAAFCTVRESRPETPHLHPVGLPFKAGSFIRQCEALPSVLPAFFRVLHGPTPLSIRVWSHAIRSSQIR